MQRHSRVVLIGAVCVGTALLLHEPLRRSTLTFLRLPFTVVKLLGQSLIALPHVPRLSQDNADLNARLLQRELETAQLREALRQAKQAQVLLDAVPAHHGVIAHVIGRSILPSQQTLLLDRGSQHGVSLESIVVDANGVIGRVVDVQSATSLVMLLTDPESRIAGIVERSRETGLLVGQGLGHGDFIYLDAEADLQEGDRVVTAGLGGPFPKGLLLGQVTRVVRDEQSGSASASVTPAARLSQLEEVLCLAPAR